MLIRSPMGPKILPVLRVTELTRVFSQENVWPFRQAVKKWP